MVTSWSSAKDSPGARSGGIFRLSRLELVTEIQECLVFERLEIALE